MEKEVKDCLDGYAIPYSSDSSLQGLIELLKNSTVDWPWISEHKELSEEFIREFQDKVSWWHIFNYQKLSKEFRGEFFEDKIYQSMYKPDADYYKSKMEEIKKELSSLKAERVLPAAIPGHRPE